jgi:serpin B
MMKQLASLGYTDRLGLQVVELPYADGDLSMVILLPEAGAFPSLAHRLQAGELSHLLADIAPANVRLTMPKYSLDTAYQLKKALLALGMADAYGEAADFSGMDGTRELFIDEVYHQAGISVDEAGTEATAASAVVMQRKGPPVDHVVSVDRPFLFLIRDLETGTILFLGHIVNPMT